MRSVFALRMFGLLLICAAVGLAQLPDPVVPNGGVVNGASFVRAGQPGHASAPGSIISIFGTGLALRLNNGDTEPFSRQARNIPLETSLGGVSVEVNGMAAPLFLVSEAFIGAGPTGERTAGQINAQLPWEVDFSGGTAELVVIRDQDGQEVRSEPVEVQVAEASPAIFTLDFGPDRAAAVNLDGSLAHSPEIVPGVNPPARPAIKGDAITLFVNGLGPVEPEAVTGDNSLDDMGGFVRRDAVLPVSVCFGEGENEREGQLIFAGMSPQFVGVGQVNVFVPEDIDAGDMVPIKLKVGDFESRDDVFIAVRDAPMAAASLSTP